MFTPAGAQSRTSRNTRRTQLNTADQPAVPIAGPPSYSYGSPNTVQPRALNLQDTNNTIAGAFGNAASQAASRRPRRSSRQSSVTDVNEDAQSTTSSRRTPRRKTPPLEEVEASINRRKSLRSGGRSTGGGSPSIASMDIIDDRIRHKDMEQVSLDYEVTQSSLGKSYEEEEAILAQLNLPTKETQYMDDTTFAIGEDTSAQEIYDEVDNRSILSKFVDNIQFLCFLLGRVAKQISAHALRLAKRCLSIIRNWLGPGLLLLTACTLAWAILHFDLVHFPRRPSVIPKYAPPITVPQTSEEMMSRLTELERYMIRYSAAASNVENRLAEFDDSIGTHSTEIHEIQENAFDSGRHWSQVSQKILVLEETLEAMKKEQKSTAGSVNDMSKSVHAIEKELISQRAELSKYIKTGLQLSDTVKRIESGQLKEGHNGNSDHEDGRSSMTVNEVKEYALQAIEDVLPEKLIVALENGRPQSTADFWRYLSTVFVRKDEADDGRDKRPQLAWSEFLKTNAENMKAFISEQQENIVGDDSAIVSKSYFMNVLKDEMATVHQDLEERLATLSKGSDQAYAHRQQHWTARSDNMSELAVEHLVASAIHRHSLDVLARPDYAAYSSGARVNPFLTSPTYLHRPTALLPRLFSRMFFNIGSSWSHPPAVAIHPSNAVGMCWAFPGTTGQLSVKLSHAIILTDIAIEHVHPDIAHDATTAPKDLEIWAYVGDEAAESASTNDADTESDSSLRHAPAAGYVHVMDVTYSVYNDAQSVQSFAVPQSMRRLTVPVNQVVYRVKSNWGNPEFTCLYRVRAIGYREVAENHDAIELDEDINSDVYL